MAMNKKRWIWIGILAGILAAAGFAWWQKHRADEAPQYQTAPVARGDLTQLVTATGQLNPVTNVQVGSQISGTIATLYADYNSAVTQGQVVAQIDPGTYQANVSQAEGDLANAKAALELAQVNANRAKELFDSKLIPQSDFDQSIATLHQAEAGVKIKSAALQKSTVDLTRCTIYSPVDGVVISRNVDVGQTVAASLSAPVLFVIANDLTKMQIDANVAEADIGTVEVGQRVDFTVDAFPDRKFHGKVVQIRNSPITVENVVTYDSVVGVNNADLKLKPGMTANVSIIVAESNDALKIPNSALRFRLPETPTGKSASETTTRSPGSRSGGSPGGPGGWGTGGSGGGHKRERRPERTVYILPANSNEPQAVQIRTGINDGVYTEVLDGLKEGDRVIISATLPQASSGESSNPFVPRRRF
jgi:HlyD family secretion protein